MPVTFTPIESVIVTAINQDEFKDFSYQNPDWRCLERGEVPKDDANDGRRALRDDLTVNLKQPLPMTPISSNQSTTNDIVSSTITVVKTDHSPIPHTETKRTPSSSSSSSTQFQMNSISTNSTSSINAQQKSMINNNTNNKSPVTNRSITDQTDM